MKILNILLACFFTLAFVGCGSSENSSSLSISFEKLSSQSLDPSNIETVIVNVSGPGIEKHIYKKVECRNNASVCSKIEVAGIPTGSARLVQLLVVAKQNSNDDSGVIFYGDKKKEINGETSIGIELAQKASFDNEEDFMGQYIPSANHSLAGKKLTGKMRMSVVLGDGKPDMTIGHTEIFSGFFHSFLLDDIAFKYHFSGWDASGSFFNDIPIFNDVSSDGLKIDDIDGSSNQVLRMALTQQVAEERDGVVSLVDFKPMIFALLGQSSKEVCYDLGSFTQFDGSAGLTMYTNLAQTSPLFTSALNPSRSPATCGGGDNWELNVPFLSERALYSGFFGPFNNGGDDSKKAFDFDPLNPAGPTFSWSIDTSSRIAGFHVFTKIDSNFNDDAIRTNDIGHGYKCDELASNGFSLSQMINKSGADYSYTISDPTHLTALPLGHLHVAVCPLAPTNNQFKYFDSAFLTNDILGGGMGSSSSALHFKIVDVNGIDLTGYSTVSGATAELPPVKGDITGDHYHYVVFKNTGTDVITFGASNPFHINFDIAGGVDIDTSPTPTGTVPSALDGIPQCTDTTAASPAKNGGLGSGVLDLAASGECYAELRVNISGVVSNPKTFHDGYSINLSGGGAGFDIVVPVAQVLNEMNPSSGFPTGLHFSAPNGKYDVKAFYLNSTSSNTIDFTNIHIGSSPSGQQSKFILEGSCFDNVTTSPTIAAFGDCILIVKYSGDGGDTSAATVTLNFDNFSIGGAGPANNSVSISGAYALGLTSSPSIMPSLNNDILDAGNVSTTFDVSYTVTNNASNGNLELLTVSETASIVENYHSDGSTVGLPSACSTALTSGASCSYVHKLYDQSDTPVEEYQFIYYRIGSTYRAYEYRLQFE